MAKNYKRFSIIKIKRNTIIFKLNSTHHVNNIFLRKIKRNDLSNNKCYFILNTLISYELVRLFNFTVYLSELVFLIVSYFSLPLFKTLRKQHIVKINNKIRITVRYILVYFNVNSEINLFKIIFIIFTSYYNIKTKAIINR